MSDEQDVEKKKPGRKKIEIDRDVLSKLASLQCTLKEMSYVMGVSVETLKRNYMDTIEVGQAEGKIKLRRSMFRNATEKDNAALQIFLAKNLLGMSDSPVDTDDTNILPWETSKE